MQKIRVAVMAIAFLAGFLPPHAFAQHCLEQMSSQAKSHTAEIVDMGDGMHFLAGLVTERDWNLTFSNFKNRHTRLTITAMAVGRHESDTCHDYLADITLTTQAIEPVGDVHKVFRTVTLGKYASSRDYVKAIRKAGMDIGDGQARETENVLKLVPISRNRQDIPIVLITPADLGFLHRSPRREDVYAQAAVYGLKTCPAEVALALRLAYPDQPKRERLMVAMEPIDTPSRYNDWKLPYTFDLFAWDPGGMNWLFTRSAFDHEYISVDDKIAFTLSTD